MTETGAVSDERDQVERLLVRGRAPRAGRSAVSDLMVPALLLRTARTQWAELVHVYVAHGPTVAFSSRDLRSPGIGRATAIARDAGFEAVVRSPGGRMVAYDDGAVVIDHLTRSSDLRQAGASTFARTAHDHAGVLQGLGIDARVGEVPGEYCPGEHSVNVGGRAKVIGSAQRITGTGSLFSTVVQVAVSDRVREVIVAVSAALGYELRESSIAGLADFSAALTADRVAGDLAADYRHRHAMTDAQLPADVLDRAAAAARQPRTAAPFDVDAYSRAAT
jgi:octanoyl-[GcvH]:protein N-octanoyltransferase